MATDRSRDRRSGRSAFLPEWWLLFLVLADFRHHVWLRQGFCTMMTLWVTLGWAAFGGVGINFGLGRLWPLDGTRMLAAVFLALRLAEAGFNMVRFGGSFWPI